MGLYVGLNQRLVVLFLFPWCLPAAVRTVAGNVLDKVPLRFEANRGQEDTRVQFVSSGSGFTLLLGEEGSVLRLRDGKRSASVITTLRHAHRGLALEGLDPLATRVSYFRGNRESNWVSGVPAYGRVQYRSVYP